MDNKLYPQGRKDGTGREGGGRRGEGKGGNGCVRAVREKDEREGGREGGSARGGNGSGRRGDAGRDGTGVGEGREWVCPRGPSLHPCGWIFTNANGKNRPRSKSGRPWTFGR
jgi:hypothetical protein